MQNTQSDIDRIFNALGDSRRRAILSIICLGPISVSDLAQPLDITLAAVVQHVQVLEESGLIHTRKVGRVRTCSMEPAGLKLASEWISDRRTLWEKRLDRLGDLLADES